MLMWGKRFKHGKRGVRQNTDKALDMFTKAAARGSALAMVDAGLIYWERGEKHKALDFYLMAAQLGNASAQCNLGISYLQGENFHKLFFFFFLQLILFLTFITFPKSCFRSGILIIICAFWILFLLLVIGWYLE